MKRLTFPDVFERGGETVTGLDVRVVAMRLTPCQYGVTG